MMSGEYANGVISKMQLHDVITIIIALLSTFWAINAETRAHANDQFKDAITNIQTNQKVLDDAVKSINEKGTFASQSWEKADTERQAAQDKRMSADEARITSDEQQLLQITPALARQEEQLNMITNLLTEQQKRK